jgi:hypothetical protein
MFALLFGVGVSLLMKSLGAEFFRVMSPIVSFVSSEVIFAPANQPFFCPRRQFNLLK